MRCTAIVISGALALAPWLASAKIGDPAALLVGQTRYSSHANYVEATDVKSHKLLWKTVVYSSIDPEKYDPELERDCAMEHHHLPQTR